MKRDFASGRQIRKPKEIIYGSVDRVKTRKHKKKKHDSKIRKKKKDKSFQESFLFQSKTILNLFTNFKEVLISFGKNEHICCQLIELKYEIF